jgi:heme exporter protein D
MPHMQAWDWVLLVIGAYIAVISLVRLMRQHRDKILQELNDQAHAEQQRQRLAKQLEKERAKNKKKAA